MTPRNLQGESRYCRGLCGSKKAIVEWTCNWSESVTTNADMDFVKKETLQLIAVRNATFVINYLGIPSINKYVVYKLVLAEPSWSFLTL